MTNKEWYHYCLSQGHPLWWIFLCDVQFRILMWICNRHYIRWIDHYCAYLMDSIDS